MKRALQLIFLLLALTITANAQHLRGGEITSKQLSGLTYEFYVYTYTIDTIRNEITIHYGDGTGESIPRIELLYLGDIKYNKYYSTHTFAGPGQYNVWIEDSFRIVNIANIPSSPSTHMIIKEELNIDPFIGSNNTPEFTKFQTEVDYDSGIIIHDPGLQDSENDSLVCSLITPIGISGYILPLATETLFIDTHTGIITWNKPVAFGTYNFCIKIEEWRQGIKIGSIMRDMCISVDSTTGINNLIFMPNLNIYPNPAIDRLFVTAFDRQLIDLTIFNLTGDIVLKRRIDNKENEINISSLTSGLYLIKLAGADWTMQKILIKE